MTSVRYVTLWLSVFLFATCALADDKRPDNKGASGSSNLLFSILKDDNGKPVRNAAVVLHPVGRDGKQSRGGFELKTDAEGKTGSEGVPYGRLRVQVLAPGFQTFGQDYTIEQPQTEITIRLKRPTDQYSIYDRPASKPQASPDQQQNPK